MPAAQQMFGLAPFYRHFTNDDVSAGPEVGVTDARVDAQLAATVGDSRSSSASLWVSRRFSLLFPPPFFCRVDALGWGASGRCTLDPFQAEMRVFSTVSS